MQCSVLKLSCFVQCSVASDITCKKRYKKGKRKMKSKKGALWTGVDKWRVGNLRLREQLQPSFDLTWDNLTLLTRVKNLMSVVSWQAWRCSVGRWTAYAVRVVMRQSLVFGLNPKAHRFCNASQLPCITAEKDPRDPFALTLSYLICSK